MIQCKLCGTPLKNDDDDTLTPLIYGRLSLHRLGVNTLGKTLGITYRR